MKTILIRLTAAGFLLGASVLVVAPSATAECETHGAIGNDPVGESFACGGVTAFYNPPMTFTKKSGLMGQDYAQASPGSAYVRIKCSRNGVTGSVATETIKSGFLGQDQTRNYHCDEDTPRLYNLKCGDTRDCGE